VESVVLGRMAREVLGALTGAGGKKLGVRQLARLTGHSTGAVYAQLHVLERAKLVQHMLDDSIPDQPARTVYWPAPGAGGVAAAFPPSSAGTDPGTAATG